jgi:hypothetical protein
VPDLDDSQTENRRRLKNNQDDDRVASDVRSSMPRSRAATLRREDNLESAAEFRLHQGNAPAFRACGSGGQPPFSNQRPLKIRTIL